MAAVQQALELSLPRTSARPSPSRLLLARVDKLFAASRTSSFFPNLSEAQSHREESSRAFVKVRSPLAARPRVGAAETRLSSSRVASRRSEPVKRSRKAMTSLETSESRSLTERARSLVPATLSRPLLGHAQMLMLRYAPLYIEKVAATAAPDSSPPPPRRRARCSTDLVLPSSLRLLAHSSSPPAGLSATRLN